MRLVQTRLSRPCIFRKGIGFAGPRRQARVSARLLYSYRSRAVTACRVHNLRLLQALMARKYVLRPLAYNSLKRAYCLRDAESRDCCYGKYTAAYQ